MVSNADRHHLLGPNPSFLWTENFVDTLRTSCQSNLYYFLMTFLMMLRIFDGPSFVFFDVLDYMYMVNFVSEHWCIELCLSSTLPNVVNTFSSKLLKIIDFISPWLTCHILKLSRLPCTRSPLLYRLHVKPSTFVRWNLCPYYFFNILIYFLFQGNLFNDFMLQVLDWWEVCTVTLFVNSWKLRFPWVRFGAYWSRYIGMIST